MRSFDIIQNSLSMPYRSYITQISFEYKLQQANVVGVSVYMKWNGDTSNKWKRKIQLFSLIKGKSN